MGAAPAAEAMQRRLLHYYGLTGQGDALARAYGQVDGFVIAEPASFRDFINPLETALQVDAAEAGGLVRVTSRLAAAPRYDLTIDDLVARPGEPPFRLTRSGAAERPRAAVVRYVDIDRDYQPGAVRAEVITGVGSGEAVVELAITSDSTRLQPTAERMLRDAAAAVETLELSTPRSVPLQPGDAFHFTPPGGRRRRYLAREVSRGATYRVTAERLDLAALQNAAGVARPPPRPTPLASTEALAVLLDLPLLPAQTAPEFIGWAAFHSDPWPGGVDLFRSPDPETGFTANAQSTTRAQIGETVAPLERGRLWTWSAEALDILIYTGSLVSRPEIDVLGGANSLALEHTPGEWEVIQFQNAALQPDGSWRLTRLLRGQLGTENTRRTGATPAGARVVMLGAGETPVAMTAADVDLPLYYKAAPIGVPIADLDPVQHVFRGVGRRPYAPVHLRAARSGNTLSLSWVRRTRIDGDAWRERAANRPSAKRRSNTGSRSATRRWSISWSRRPPPISTSPASPGPTKSGSAKSPRPGDRANRRGSIFHSDEEPWRPPISTCRRSPPRKRKSMSPITRRWPWRTRCCAAWW